MAARWSGTVSSPFGPPFPVDVTFRPDETYSATCLSGPPCVAFYYGSDADSPEKTYHPVNLNSDGSVSGTIRIFFDTGVVVGQLRQVRLSDDLSELGFEFVPAWSGEIGPFVYTLRCTDP